MEKLKKYTYAILAVLIAGAAYTGYDINVSDSSIEPAQAVVQQEEENLPSYSFKNSDLLSEHYEKHGIEMGFTSAEDYEIAASKVVTNPNSLHKLEAEDGDDVYYLESTNEFVIVSKKGYIRTYFKPDSGIKYFNKQ